MSEDATPSFREQTMNRLAEERGNRVEEPAPENVQGTAPEVIEDEPIGTPEHDTEELNELEAQAVDDEVESLDEYESSEEAPDEVEHDWEQRYKDLQSEYTKLTQNREEFESEMAQQLTEVKRREFELDDVLQESRQHAELLVNAMKGQANQYRTMNWSAIPADQLPQYKQAAEQAFAQEQQVTQALDAIKGRQQEAFKQQVEREAALSLTRLRKTIPGWNNEVYGNLREYSQKRGLDPQLFDAITNPAVIEMIHDSYAYRSANSKAKTVSKRKSQKISTANSPGRVRDARGKFASAQQAFNETPNQRGAFAKMKQAQLAMEKK